MKLFHLSTLPAVPLGMHGEGRALVLPALVPEPHVEPILGWWGRSLRAGLPRIDVDWDTGLSPASVRLLGRARDSFGRDGVLVVVRLKVEENDLDAVAGAPALASFEHVALVTRHRALQVRLRQLSQACAAVVRALGDEWRTRAPELGLRVEAFDEIRDSLAGLLDPAEVVEAVNDLAEVGLAGLRPDAQVATVRRRVVTRQLAALSPDLLVALIAMATGHSTEVSPADRDELAERDLVVGGALRGWAAWLPDVRVVEGLFSERGPLPRAEQRLEGWQAKLLEAARRMRSLCRVPRAVWADPDVALAGDLVDSGALDEAKAALDRLAVGLDARPLDWRSDYLYVVGTLRRAEGDPPRAEAAFREAIDAAQLAEAPEYEVVCRWTLAEMLADSARWAEAEVELRGVVDLEAELQEPLTARGMTLHNLGQILIHLDGWVEAEAVCREALRLKEVGADTPTSRGITQHNLAYVLHELGRLAEAEAAFREALRLLEEGTDAAASRANTAFQLAVLLEQQGRWPEAEAGYREVMRLEDEAGAGAGSRGETLHRLAVVLDQQGRWPEAEATFREALRLMEEGDAKARVLRGTLRALAEGLQRHGNPDEAAALRFRATALKHGLRVD